MINKKSGGNMEANCTRGSLRASIAQRSRTEVNANFANSVASVPSLHHARMYTLRNGIVLADGNQLLLSITHFHIPSVGPIVASHNHLSSVIGPSHIFVT